MLRDVLGFDSWHIERKFWDPHEEADKYIKATEEEREEIRKVYAERRSQLQERARALPRVVRQRSRYAKRRDLDCTLDREIAKHLFEVGFSNRAIEKSTGIGRNRIARLRKELDDRF